jgi:type VI secretion system secreted protein Hcp
MAIYLELEGIKGSATDAAFKEQIECNSFQWGAGLAVDRAGNGNRTATKASISEISLSKVTDKSSELLFKSLLKGTVVQKGQISFAATSEGESVAYLTIKLEDVIVSGFSVSSGGDMPHESLTLNIGKFDQSFSDRDEDNKGTATHLIYDLVAAKLG